MVIYRVSDLTGENIFDDLAGDVSTNSHRITLVAHWVTEIRKDACLAAVIKTDLNTDVIYKGESEFTADIAVPGSPKQSCASELRYTGVASSNVECMVVEANTERGHKGTDFYIDIPYYISRLDHFSGGMHNMPNTKALEWHTCCRVVTYRSHDRICQARTHFECEGHCMKRIRCSSIGTCLFW